MEDDEDTRECLRRVYRSEKYMSYFFDDWLEEELEKIDIENDLNFSKGK